MGPEAQRDPEEIHLLKPYLPEDAVEATETPSEALTRVLGGLTLRTHSVTLNQHIPLCFTCPEQVRPVRLGVYTTGQSSTVTPTLEAMRHSHSQRHACTPMPERTLTQKVTRRDGEARLPPRTRPRVHNTGLGGHVQPQHGVRVLPLANGHFHHTDGTLCPQQAEGSLSRSSDQTVKAGTDSPSEEHVCILHVLSGKEEGPQVRVHLSWTKEVEWAQSRNSRKKSAEQTWCRCVSPRELPSSHLCPSHQPVGASQQQPPVIAVCDNMAFAMEALSPRKCCSGPHAGSLLRGISQKLCWRKRYHVTSVGLVS
ncbi:uncharacterized protein LOC128311389 [Acinonyx jubatus]|uniref:Uncharacterized protein LOC128311389 n=1 Tax=Acinonyx jubatus TaxID=32536 RepID=A0ABM3ND63_ACIJB|nr:uncharacterized protein LOC128311389 [Acinonyx jubatus]